MRKPEETIDVDGALVLLKEAGGRPQTVVSGAQLSVIRPGSRESKIPLPLWKRGVLCCDRTSQSSEGEDRPLAKSWGRTVEVLAIKIK